MSGSILLGLIVCNAIWSANPLMGKIMMQEMPALHVSWVRYFLALLMAYALLPILYFKKPQTISPVKVVSTNFKWIALGGLVTFFGSAYVQYAGLAISTATANSLLVAMEPLCAVLLARIFLGESFKFRQVVAFALAFLGFCLLSNINPHDISGSIGLFSVGNLLLLLSMPAEATYSVVSRKIAGKITPFSLLLFTLTLGFTVFSLFLIAKGDGLPNIFAMSPKAWLAALWLGSLGTTLGYTYWSLALEDAPVAAVSLTLFVQPITGSIIGWYFLGETLHFWQYMGGLFILIALYIQTLFRRKRNEMASNK